MAEITVFNVASYLLEGGTGKIQNCNFIIMKWPQQILFHFASLD